MKAENRMNELLGYTSSLQLGYLTAHLQEILLRISAMTTQAFRR